MSNQNMDWPGFEPPTNGDWDQPNAKQPSKAIGGHWHAAQTVTALLVVTALSFLMAYLTRNIQKRPIWMMGLIFMVPAAAMLFSALFVENATSAMTPSFSRKAQTIVALVATLLTFVVGCLSDLIYLQGFIQHDNVIFVLDKSSSQTELSIGGNTRDEDNKTALRRIIDQMSDGDLTGLVLFNDSVISSVPLAPLSQDQRAHILSSISTSPSGGTYFYQPLNEALKMAESSSQAQKRKTKIVILTDGQEFQDNIAKSLCYNTADVIARCKAVNAVISCVQTSTQMDTSVTTVISRTGGEGVYVNNAAQLASTLSNISLSDQDLLRSGDSSARVISLIMLLLEGLTLGFGLSLMLSVSGQFRIQLILSPLMGIAAFFLLKMMSGNIKPYWIAEGAAFSLLGIVFMRRNHESGSYRPAPQQGSNQAPASGDPFSDL